MNNSLTALASPDSNREIIEKSAAELGLNVIYSKAENDEIRLCLDDDGLSLCGDGLSMRGDFSRMLPRLRTANLRGEMLCRAAKIKNAENPMTLIDATAGMGEDSLLLAAYGFEVRLFELDPVIAMLLKDTLRRAKSIPELSEIISRMTLVCGDSISALSRLEAAPDVIYLDPMFPAKQKSALVKKKFQLIHRLEAPCSNEVELLSAAMAAHPRKIVIKRPAKAAVLANVKPSYSIDGNGIRYDCIVLS